MSFCLSGVDVLNKQLTLQESSQLLVTDGLYRRQPFPHDSSILLIVNLTNYRHFRIKPHQEKTVLLNVCFSNLKKKKILRHFDTPDHRGVRGSNLWSSVTSLRGALWGKTRQKAALWSHRSTHSAIARLTGRCNPVIRAGSRGGLWLLEFLDWWWSRLLPVDPPAT